MSRSIVCTSFSRSFRKRLPALERAPKILDSAVHYCSLARTTRAPQAELLLGTRTTPSEIINEIRAQQPEADGA